jgi:expansin (peptidoglycan-binding protein)
MRRAAGRLGAAVIVAGGVVAAGAPVGAAPAERAEVVPGAGMATHYDSDGGGNCSFPAGETDGLDVALSEVEYGTADACGGYLDVTGPEGTVRVQITNRCPECEVGHIDLSRAAFERIAPLEAGQVDVTYTLVRDPEVDEPIALRVKEGSSRWWMQIQVIDAGNPIASVELERRDGWRSLSRSRDNFWTAEDPGPGDGPFTVRITDVNGHVATVGGVSLSPDEVQRTEVRLYGSGGGSGPPAPAPAPPPPTTAAPPPTAAPTTPAPTLPPTTLPPPTTVPPPTTTLPRVAAGSRPFDPDASGEVTAASDGGRAEALMAAIAVVVVTALGVAAVVVRRRRASAAGDPSSGAFAPLDPRSPTSTSPRTRPFDRPAFGPTARPAFGPPRPTAPAALPTPPAGTPPPARR